MWRNYCAQFNLGTDEMPKQTKNKRLSVVSLFSGAMGFDLGLERAGFSIKVAVECDKHALETVRLNRPDLPVIGRRIEDVASEEILEAAGLKPREPTIVVAGPSCQAFSTAGQRGSLGDPRGLMFEHFIRVVRETQPRFFIMENVHGMLSAAVKHRPLKERGPGYPPLEPDEELGSAFRVVSAKLRDLGYYSIFDVLNAADFGVPQRRQRLVIIGSREGENISMPLPTHSENGTANLPLWRSFRDAVDGLEDNAPEFCRFLPSREKYLRKVPEGGNWRDLPASIQKQAMGGAYASWGGRSGFFRRLALDKPTPALTTQPDSKATTLCHPLELRPLTVREYARVQQFPDDWQFCGTVRKKYEQVGNAVPLGLGEAIGRSIRKVMRSRKLHRRKGKVECWNVNLLVRLSHRPRTIVNPPRMRKDASRETISDWYDGEPRLRDDALQYIPPELAEQLHQLRGSGEKVA